MFKSIAIWLVQKLITEKFFKELIITGLEDIARPMAKKTGTRFDDRVIDNIIEALKND